MIGKRLRGAVNGRLGAHFHRLEEEAAEEVERVVNAAIGRFTEVATEFCAHNSRMDGVDHDTGSCGGSSKKPSRLCPSRIRVDHRGEPLTLQATSQFFGEEDVGQFGLAVGAVGVVVSLGHDVVEIDGASCAGKKTVSCAIREGRGGGEGVIGGLTDVGHGRQVDDAATARLFDRVQQQQRPQKVAQVVDSELHLETVFGDPVRTHHDTWV